MQETFVPTEGHILVQGNESTYVGSTHWTAILDNINELKSVIVSDDVSLDERTDQGNINNHEHLSLFSAFPPNTLEEILQTLPPRPQVDRYLSAYFNAKYLVLPVLHTRQFQRQYEEFWKNPLGTPALWISIVFSLICISTVIGQKSPSATSSPEDAQSRREDFLGAATQCIILGDYAKPQKHVLEALLLFAQCKYVAAFDPSREVGLILAIVFRFAFQMGYHRDPDHFSNMSAFDGEMRRRIWAICRQIDLLLAFQLGLPTYIPTDSFDTKAFRNLEDDDFDEDTLQLPASRPETEATRFLHFVAKCRLTTAFSKAFRSAISLAPVSIETVMELDREVREAQGQIPPPLQNRSIASSFADSSTIIMARIDCEMLYRKTLCVLHRKQMILGNAYSTSVCTESATEILKHLIDLHKELQPGGQLYAEQWILSSFAVHDFQLAAMILCLALSQNRKAKVRQHTENSSESQAQLDLIRKTYHVFADLSVAWKAAERVANMLKSMLWSLEQEAGDINLGAASRDHERFVQRQTSLLSTQPSPMPSNSLGFTQDPFDSLASLPNDIDWAYLDQYCLDVNPGAYDFGDVDTSIAASVHRRK